MNRGMKMVIVAVLLACTAGFQGALAAPANGKAVSAKETIQTPQTKMPAEAKTTDNVGARASINTASAEELAQAMNGVGLKKAQAIVSYREEYGPFKTLDDLKQVPGMGSSLVERNLSHLTL
ncbi:helix-hairpin-helix domain-containing protein [Klebsiella aerogenes]|uniref:helix-hairpin-helix domain-containing protein n=1 Tax=Klebsiella aerogenes TaxID=548 RepID=UPI001BD472D4|nr:helix-hairpin-helix domain-containing protein [Klebsiella aerogenes]MDQ8583664.1 helix-hairpin-helix domain-containing protein [Klebsiella aerogenes]